MRYAAAVLTVLLTFAATSVAAPNLLFVLLDEWRTEPSYSTPELFAWRERNLPNLRRLERTGIEWSQHRIATAACAPSRASLLTGVVSTGVEQTDGAAKLAWDPEMAWLDPATVPTLGHWLEANGRTSGFIGKWHLSRADVVVAGTQGESVPSYDAEGLPDLAAERLYRTNDRLSAFGFHDWVGPEPHGRDPLNSGASAGVNTTVATGRDAAYTRQAIDWIRDRRAPGWSLVWAPVGPHDIATVGSYTLHGNISGFAYPIDPSLPAFPTPPADDLTTKPSTQTAYRDGYASLFQPIEDADEVRRIYYSLLAETDRRLGQVLAALDASPFADDTWIVLTSDHGDLLGAHPSSDGSDRNGVGLWQKWYTAYDEVLRVPMIWVPPRGEVGWATGRKINALTSHLDVLPTLIDVLGLERQPDPSRFVDGQPDLAPSRSDLLLAESLLHSDSVVRFHTEDDPSRGTTGTDWTGLRSPTQIAGPTVIDAVVRRTGRTTW